MPLSETIESVNLASSRTQQSGQLFHVKRMSTGGVSGDMVQPHRQTVSTVPASDEGNQLLRSRVRDLNGQAPTVPSTPSRRKSAWPLWRAYSWIRWSMTKRRETCSFQRG